MTPHELENIQALSVGEYEEGPAGTNWQTYSIECTYTVCGYGFGPCLAVAGC